MKTLIETKTGRVVNAGDVITLDGTAHILTDFDVPGLVGRGILTFMCDKPSNEKDNTKMAGEMYKDNLPTKEIDNDANLCSVHHDVNPTVIIKQIVGFSHPKLESIMLNWGYEKKLGTKERIFNTLTILWYAHPQSLLAIALKELSKEVNEYFTLSPGQVGYAISLLDFSIVPVIHDEQVDLDNAPVAIFDSKEAALYAKEVCQEIIDELKNGEQED